MDPRLGDLLRLLVENVIETGEPAGSQYLVETYGLAVSPATVRNWFSELEQSGHIKQPHTSSGRMPTELGYKTYIEELMEIKPLKKKQKTVMGNSCHHVNEEVERIKLLTRSMAEMIGNSAFVGFAGNDTYYTGLSYLFAQPEFRDWNCTVSLGKVLDRLDEVLLFVRKKLFHQPTAFIGSQCPFGQSCGSIMLTLPDGALMGILGPMRLDYKTGIALLNESKRLIMA